MTQANNVAIESSQINSSGVLQPAGGGTGVTTSTGSGSVVLATSPTLTTPNLGTPSAINLSNATSLAKAALPSGTVIQVVSTILGSTFTTSSGSYVTANSASITLSSTANKLISMAWFPISNSYGSYNGNSYAILVNSGATNNQGNGSFQLTTGTGAFVVSIVRYDTPGQLSNTVTQSIAMSGGTSVSLLAGAQIILMEVVG